MVLITPYDSIENIAQDTYPIYPMSIMLRDKFNSYNRIKNIKSPTLIIIAENDNIIPYKYSSRLIQAFLPSQVTVEIIKEAGHNNLSYQDNYFFCLKNFMQ